MRVLQVVDNLSKDSGVSSFLMNIYKRIDREKIQFDFLICPNRNSLKNKNYITEIEKMGGKVYVIPSILSAGTFRQGVKDSAEFFEKHAQEYDAVHLHTPSLALFTLKYASKKGMKVRILHSHSTMTSTNKIKSMINRVLINLGRNYATDKFACSTEAGEFLFGTREGVQILYNAVDTKRFSFFPKMRNTLREKMQLNNDFVAIHISNFTPIKNHEFLYEVIERTVKENPNVKFLFLGDGETKEKFENTLKEKNLLQYCIFTGKVGNVEEYLQAADLLLLPSLKEGLPVTVVEAQATGLECLVSASVTRECNAGNVEFLPFDQKKWSDLIVEKSKNDNSKRNISALQFEESVFNLENEAQRISKIYQNLLCR